MTTKREGKWKTTRDGDSTEERRMRMQIKEGKPYICCWADSNSDANQQDGT